MFSTQQLKCIQITCGEEGKVFVPTNSSCVCPEEKPYED